MVTEVSGTVLRRYLMANGMAFSALSLLSFQQRAIRVTTVNFLRLIETATQNRTMQELAGPCPDFRVLDQEILVEASAAFPI